MPGQFHWKMLQSGTIAFEMGSRLWFHHDFDRRPRLIGMITGIVANTNLSAQLRGGVPGFPQGDPGRLPGRVCDPGGQALKVPKFMAGIIPIIVIPMVATVVSCLAFIHVLGAPIAACSPGLTELAVEGAHRRQCPLCWASSWA